MSEEMFTWVVLAVGLFGVLLLALAVGGRSR